MLEILGVLLTVLGKFIFMDYLNRKLPFTCIAILAWTGYVIYQNKTNPGIMKYWGFRTDNFKAALRLVLPFGFVSVVLFIAIGIYQGTIHLTWHIIPLLILYPVWGTIQQFLLIALTAGNLHNFQKPLPKAVIVILCAALFGLIHYPYLWLMLGTFVLAICYGLIYLRQKNLYVLGLFHGWLGALFFYTVVDRDPFLETFGRFLNM